MNIHQRSRPHFNINTYTFIQELSTHLHNIQVSRVIQVIRGFLGSEAFQDPRHYRIQDILESGTFQDQGYLRIWGIIGYGAIQDPVHFKDPGKFQNPQLGKWDTFKPDCLIRISNVDTFKFLIKPLFFGYRTDKSKTGFQN